MLVRSILESVIPRGRLRSAPTDLNLLMGRDT